MSVGCPPPLQVRLKMLDIAEETREKWAVRTMRIFYKFFKLQKGEWEMEQLRAEVGTMREMEAMRKLAESSAAGVNTNASDMTTAIKDAVAAAKANEKLEGRV